MRKLSSDPSAIIAIADARRQWQEIASHALPTAPAAWVRPDDYQDLDDALEPAPPPPH